MTDRPPEPPRSPLPLLATVPGTLWAAVVFWTFGFVLPPGPETPGQWSVLAFFVLFLAAAHGGSTFFGLALLLPVRHRSPGLALLLSAALGALYTALSLSLLKFVAVRSHLRWNDVRFVLGSIEQVVGEATPTELRLLAFALALPIALTIGFYALIRRLSQRLERHQLPVAAVVGLTGILGLVALGAARVEARWLAKTLLPETAIVARWLHRSGLVGAELPPPDPTRQARIAPYRAPVEMPPHDVVVVMLESVPWQRLLGPLARSDSTPRIAELVAESVSFDRAYAASSHSDYAQTSILASLHPRKSDYHDFFVDLDYPRSLPWDLLGPLGWRTAVFSTQNERWGNMRSFLVTPALETFRHAPDFVGARRHGRSAESKAFEESVVPRFLDWVATDRERPYVAYLNFQATHFPYSWPSGFDPPYGEAPLPPGVSFASYPRADVPRMLDRFHNALGYQDLWLGRLIDGLRGLGRWQTTALLLVADHGEAFHEHGMVTHGTALFDEQLHVPMLLRAPGLPAGRVERPVSVLDGLPTLLRAIGLPANGAWQGSDALQDVETVPTARRTIPFTLQGMTNADGLLHGRYKYFVDHDRGWRALFDLELDPGETRNLVSAQPAMASDLTAHLDRFLALQLGYYLSRAWEEGWYPPRLP